MLYESMGLWCNNYGKPDQNKNVEIIYDTEPEACKKVCTDRDDCHFYATGSGTYAKRCNIYTHECVDWKMPNNNDWTSMFTYHRKKKTQESTSLSASYTQRGRKIGATHTETEIASSYTIKVAQQLKNVSKSAQKPEKIANSMPSVAVRLQIDATFTNRNAQNGRMIICTPLYITQKTNRLMEYFFFEHTVEKQMSSEPAKETPQKKRTRTRRSQKCGKTRVLKQL